MADTTSAPGVQFSTNGHQPEDATLLEAMAQYGNHEVFVDRLITFLGSGNYATRILYEPAYQQRCAGIKRDHRALYKGKLLRAVSLTLTPAEAQAWDREIDVWVYSQERLVTVPLSSIETEQVSWLWEPYIPLRKLTMVEGDPEAGKTFLMLQVAASITRGYRLPDQEGHVGKPDPTRTGNVLYLTAEDGLADTIRPRAEQLGADLDRLFVVPSPDLFPMDMQPFSLARPHLLSAAIEEREARLVILDPITAFLGAEMDMHRANEVRPVMTTLVTMATQRSCAMVALRHWTKAPGGKARYRGQGNVDFTAAARSVLSVGESPEDERLRVMAQAKNSVSTRGTSMLFQITNTGLQWAGTSTLTADELSAAQPKKHHHQRQDAMKWLKDYLRDGPQPADMVIHAAEAVGIPERTLKRAKEHLHVLSLKDEKVWFWRLPTFQKKWERDRYPGQEDDDD